MLYVSLSLRYQRQLYLICPGEIEAFFQEAAEAAQGNGGRVCRTVSGCVFSFADGDFCRAFSVSLTLDALLQRIRKYSARIREYRIFADTSAGELTPEQLAERMSVCENMILPDRAVLLTQESASLLSPYALCEPLSADRRLWIYRGQKSVSAADAAPEAESCPREIPVQPFFGTESGGRVALLSALLNTASGLAQLFPVRKFLTKKEKPLFAEGERAAARFASRRFSSAHPGWLLQDCEDWGCLFFTVFARFTAERWHSETVRLLLPPVTDAEEDAARLALRLEGIVRFYPAGSSAGNPADGETGSGQMPDGSPVPADILDAAYLLCRAAEFLYMGETDAFFAFLGKDSHFRSAVENGIRAAGFPSGPAFFPCVRRLADEDFPPPERRRHLDRFLSDFLWQKYGDGRIPASRGFLRVLQKLGRKIPDSFLAAVAFRDRDPVAVAAERAGGFSSASVADAIRRLAESDRKLRRGAFKDALGLAKNALQEFQRKNIPAGECRAFSVLARISFSRADASSGDAFPYLEYALEIAEKMQDPDVRMNGLFDFASMYFLSGDFGSALRFAGKLRTLAGECSDRAWETAVLFLEGRIRFALGNYREAEKVFILAEDFDSARCAGRAAPLCRVWASRCRVYQTKNSQETDFLLNMAAEIPEALLFALEETAKMSARQDPAEAAEFLARNFPETVTAPEAEDDFLPPGDWEWKSGFSAAEDRFFRGKPAGSFSVLYAAFLAFCRASAGGGKADAGKRISALIRDNLSGRDPYAPLLFYLCWELENSVSGCNSTDALPFLSRAFKSLQILAGSIADSGMRECFLTGPYWNARLYAAARENKLV